MTEILEKLMTPTRPKIHRTAWRFARVVAPWLALALAGCASAPPPLSELDDAAALIERAEAEDAGRHAPMELRFADEKLARARAAVDDKDYARAVLLADQAEVDAEFAFAKARQAKARLAVEAKAAENEQLRRDVGGETP
jgi:hypothetical protein